MKNIIYSLIVMLPMYIGVDQDMISSRIPIRARCHADVPRPIPRRFELPPEHNPRGAEVEAPKAEAKADETVPSTRNKNFFNERDMLLHRDVEGKFKGENGDVTIARISRSHETNDIFPQDFLKRQVDAPELIYAFPKNPAEYKSSFGRSELSQKEIAELKKIDSFVSGIKEGKTEIKGGEAELKLKIEKTNGSPVVIFAHSTNGGKSIVFPNGKISSAAQIHAICRAAAKNCMILTCHGRDFLIKGNLNVFHAIKMWKSAYKKSLLFKNKGESFTVGDFRSEMISIRSQIVLRERIAISVLTTGIGGVYVVTNSINEHKKIGKNKGYRKF